MRILMVGNFNVGWDSSICDELHIANALREAGHEVLQIQREHFAVPDGKYDLAIFSQWHSYPNDFVFLLQEICKTVAYWSFDYQWHEQESWHFKLATEADIFFSKEMEHRTEYEKMGANFQWLSQDFAPSFLDRVEGVKKDIDVLFTGTKIDHATDRTRLIKLIDENFDLQVYALNSDSWKAEGIKNANQSVVDHGLPELIARAKIHISIDHINSEGYWSDRNAQIMACGGFVLFKYVPMSEVVFGPWITYFHTDQQVLNLIKKYLADDDTREMWANGGYEYARNNLLVGNRVHQMLQKVRHHENLSV